jgi:hypothetical protein
MRPSPRMIGYMLALAVLTGCAASGPTSGAPRDPLQAPERFSIVYDADAFELATELAIAPDRAWEVLPAVFRDLGLPAAASSNARERVMMTPHMRVRGELYPGELTSSYLDCGSASTGGARADSYEVTFVIIARLTALDESRTKVETIVDGHAQDPLRRGSVRCRSTGRFEEQLNELLARRGRG